MKRETKNDNFIDKKMDRYTDTYCAAQHMCEYCLLLLRLHVHRESIANLLTNIFCSFEIKRKFLSCIIANLYRKSICQLKHNIVVDEKFLTQWHKSFYYTYAVLFLNNSWFTKLVLHFAVHSEGLSLHPQQVDTYLLSAVCRFYNERQEIKITRKRRGRFEKEKQKRRSSSQDNAKDN